MAEDEVKPRLAPHAAHRPLESSRRGGSSTVVVTTRPPRRPRAVGCAPALLMDQTVVIFLDETLDAIDALSAWICRPVA